MRSGALLFASGNLKEHVEVTNPYHHASYIYAEYNDKIFGHKTSVNLCKKAVFSLCLDIDVVLCAEDSNPMLEITKLLDIPVVKKIEDIFKSLSSAQETEPEPVLYCSGCELTGGNPSEKCDKATEDCHFYKTLDDAMQGDVVKKS